MESSELVYVCIKKKSGADSEDGLMSSDVSQCHTGVIPSCVGSFVHVNAEVALRQSSSQDWLLIVLPLGEVLQIACAWKSVCYSLSSKEIQTEMWWLIVSLKETMQFSTIVCSGRQCWGNKIWTELWEVLPSHTKDSPILWLQVAVQDSISSSTI